MSLSRVCELGHCSNDLTASGGERGVMPLVVHVKMKKEINVTKSLFRREITIFLKFGTNLASCPGF